MTAVVQRVTGAAVTVEGAIVGRIESGIVALVAVERADTEKDAAWMANKLVSLRIFRNADKHFDLDIRQAGGSMLLVSNFTVSANTAEGRRPSFDAAAPPDAARPLFERLIDAVRATGVEVQIGTFGADMRVQSINDGPATFIVKVPHPQ